MRVYVAGKTNAYHEVRQVQKLVRACGHEITFDWTKVIEELGGDSNEVPTTLEQRRGYAQSDWGGVYACDFFIACGHPHVHGTLIELGMAIAYKRPCRLLWWDRCARTSIFEDLPLVRRVNIQELAEELWAISLRQRGLDQSPVFRVLDDGALELEGGTRIG